MQLAGNKESEDYWKLKDFLWQIRISNDNEKTLIKNIAKELKKPKKIPAIYFNYLNKYKMTPPTRKTIKIDGVNYFDDYGDCTNKQIIELAKSTLKDRLDLIDKYKDLGFGDVYKDGDNLIKEIIEALKKIEYKKNLKIKELEEIRKEKERILKEKQDIEAHDKVKPEIDLRYNEALTFLNLSKYPEAIFSFSQAIKLDNFNKETRDMFYPRAMAKFEVGDFMGCVKDGNMSTNKFGKRSECYYLIGLSHFHLREYEKAILNLKYSIELDEESEKAYFYKGLSEIYYFKEIGNEKYKTQGLLDLSKSGELGYFDAYAEIKKHSS